MPRFTVRFTVPTYLQDIPVFFRFLYKYARRRGYHWFSKFESLKDIVVDLLYKRRGKYTRPFLHFGTIALIFFVITFGPLILEETQKEENEGDLSSGILGSAFAYGTDLSTTESEGVKQFRGGEIFTHRVQDGETLSSIAEKYSLKVETLLWENGLEKNAKIKPGQDLRILPIDGVRHKVSRGETIYTIAKKYGLDQEAEAQGIVNYPFNEFKNDETFELAIGQTLMVPEGVKPEERKVTPAGGARFGRLTPDAGSVTASGSFAWPAAGIITQRYSFYHKAFDIANRGGGPILAADSGTVIVSGWPDNSGYGNRVMIDHGNGYVTLYAHMSVLQVKAGQKVSRGNVLGQMGSTGRSTGTHLHFEIRYGGVPQNPATWLK